MFVYTVTGVNFLLIKQLQRGAKCFCEVWLNLILFQSGILPQIQVKTKKKVFATFWFYLRQEFQIYANKTRRPEYFAPFSVRPEGVLPPSPPKINTYVYCIYLISSKNEG